MFCFYFFFFKQKTAYELRISDWSSDVCSSDLHAGQQLPAVPQLHGNDAHRLRRVAARAVERHDLPAPVGGQPGWPGAQIAADRPSGRVGDRKSVVEGKSVCVRVDLGGRRNTKKKITTGNNKKRQR